MLQVYVSNVSAVSNVCCKCLSRCCICCIGYTRMLQVYVINVSAFSNVCCKVLYLDVAYVAVAIHICCKCMFVNVSFISDVCCSKCFMLQVLHDQALEVGIDGGGSLGCTGPRMCAGSQAGAAAPTCMRRCMGTCVPQQQAELSRQAWQQQCAATTAAARSQTQQQRVGGRAGRV